MYKIFKKYYKQRGDSKIKFYFIVMYKQKSITGERWREVMEVKSSMDGGTYTEIKEFYTIESAREYVANVSETLPEDEEMEL